MRAGCFCPAPESPLILSSVGIVSSLSQCPDVPLPVDCRPARPDELHAALRIVLGSNGVPADSQEVLDFLTLAEQRGLGIGDMWVAQRDLQMIWALLAMPTPGRTVLLFLPNHFSKDDAMAALVDAVCDHFGSRDVRLAQLLLDPRDIAGQRLFASHGFRRMAELIYMHAQVRAQAMPPALPPGFAWESYSSRTHRLFADTIVQTYRDSLDCPGLNGLREIDDVLAGHKGAGQFNPRYWFVLTERGIGRGALLLSKIAGIDAAELVYLGLVPEARRRGLGEVLMHQGIASTSEMGATRLSMAVDSANVPAMKLYCRFGAARAGSKIAMMRLLSR